ncbi:TPA: hypothetical protein ACE6KF_001373 [Neisseria gonorrhoeae]
MAAIREKRGRRQGKPMFQRTGRHIERRPMKVKEYISIFIFRFDILFFLGGFYTPTEKKMMNCLLDSY